MSPLSGSGTGTGIGPSLDSVGFPGLGLQVIFDEAMTANAALSSTGSYTVAPTGAGDAVSVTAVTLGPGTTPSYVVLSLSGIMSEGETYRVTVSASLLDAAGNPMDAGGLTLDFIAPAAPGQRGDLGVLEALTGVMGEANNGLAGLRMTRLTAVAAQGDTSFLVESTLDWEDSGLVSLDGVKYAYTGKTISSLTGITHIQAGASIAGAATDHRDDSVVVDITRAYSALDLLRRALLVDYAEGADLYALGRNIGVSRLPMFSDDDQFREVIKALAYNPKGTVYGLELALEALVGAGNYEIYEDRVLYPGRVFIRISSTYFESDTPAGKAYLGDLETVEVDAGLGSVTLGAAPLRVNRIKTHPLQADFDLRSQIPSAASAEFPEGTTSYPWTYAGSEAEGTAVANNPGLYTGFISTGGTVYYEVSDADGAALSSGFGKFSMRALIAIPTGAALGTGAAQLQWGAANGARKVRTSIIQGTTGATFKVALTDGSSVLGSAVELDRDEFHDIAVISDGTIAELWVNGSLEESQAVTAFAVDSGHYADFGCLSGLSTLGFFVKEISVAFNNLEDFWAYYGTAGTVATANPTQFDDNLGTPELGAGDVGKAICITDSAITNAQGGNNNGRFVVATYVSPGIVTLEGPLRPDYADVTTSSRVVIDDADAFQFPDDLGKTIVLSGSSLGNDGSYTIDKLLEPETLVDLESFASPVAQKTNVCEVTVSTLAVEQDLAYRLDPAFATESGLDWVLSDAGSLAGAVGTLRESLWGSGIWLDVQHTDVLSAQAAHSAAENEVLTAGPPATYELYPFYLSDILEFVEAYLDDLTVAGVIPVFEPLS